MSQRFQVARAAELESLQVFRDFIGSCCAKFSIQADIVYDLKLAVDEACTNIITHGYKGMDPGSIILSFRISQDRILVQITDFGYAFEPEEKPAPDIETLLGDPESVSLGLYFIYQTMDNIDYCTSVEGNTLTFTKFLRTEPEIHE
jgi:serine/threonine-protein kinase RsbW